MTDLETDQSEKPERGEAESCSAKIVSTLELPRRTSRPLPESNRTAEREASQQIFCGLLSFALGFIAYWWLASRDLDFFMFDLPTLNDLVGEWTTLVHYVYASCSCLTGVAILRHFPRSGRSPAIAISASALLGTIAAIVLTLMLAAFLAAVLSILGVLALFFHTGDR